MADRDILDQIDDVITWHGRSPDAMVWTSEPPKLLPTPALHINAEAAQAAFARAGEAVQAFAAAFQPIAEGIGRNLKAMAKVFAEVAPTLVELDRESQRARSAMKSEYARRRRARGRRR